MLGGVRITLCQQQVWVSLNFAEHMERPTSGGSGVLAVGGFLAAAMAAMMRL